MNPRQTLIAILLLLAATMSWGGMFPVAKPALAILDPYYMTWIRYGAAAIIFLVLLMVREGKGSLRTEGRLPALFLLGSLGFAGFNLLAFNGLAHTRPEHGAVIMATMPMITVLLTWLFQGTRPAGFTMMMILLAFSGVFLVITGGDPVRAFSGGEAHWDLLFLAGAVCWVTYTMGGARFPSWSPLRYTAITCTLGVITLGAISLTLTAAGIIRTPSATTLVNLAAPLSYLIIMGGVVAVLSWNTGIRMLGAVNGVLFINFVPITAFTIGALKGHAFSATEIIGALFVITALVLNNLFLRRVQSGVRPESAGSVDETPNLSRTTNPGPASPSVSSAS
ncbi:DMT family transporter [Marinobacter koreensis]|uniref:DMT family transporter n=1 Tax=Marinobacter koreensis TaxID=335974 RepID=A0ABW0RNE0_9GAMM|nr:DMT family transporter [Marinobacter koreensis]MCK7549668.1 DMT family transporter [Marinobacter koreensis]